jgi:hypothetical protein
MNKTPWRVSNKDLINPLGKDVNLDESKSLTFGRASQAELNTTYAI